MVTQIQRESPRIQSWEDVSAREITQHFDRHARKYVLIGLAVLIYMTTDAAELLVPFP